MDGIWSYVLSYVLAPGGSAIVGGYLVMKFLGDKLISHKLEKEVERYKSELNEKTEVLKAKLSIYANEEAVAFTRIDSQRSDAVISVFNRMRSVINSLAALVSGSPIRDGSPYDNFLYYQTHFEEGISACEVLMHTLSDNAIFFHESLYVEVAGFSQSVSDLIAGELRPLRQGIAQGQTVEHLLNRAETGASHVRRVFDTITKPSYINIVEEFRKELGVRALSEDQ